MTAPIGICLDPLDVLFFRGGRPFDAANRVEGELPNPQTLAGALRTALLAQHAPSDLFRKLRGRGDILPRLIAAGAPEWVLKSRFRGPWLALRDDRSATIEPLVPAPAILYRDEERHTLYRNGPLAADKLPGWPSTGLLPLWRSSGADAKAATGYLTPAGLSEFLHGRIPTAAQWIRPGALFDYDNRTGIAIRPDAFTTEESQIYGIKLLVLKPTTEIDGKKYRVCFYAEMIPGDAAPDGDLLSGPLPFGGEGRYVTARQVPAFAWPSVSATGNRAMHLMITPGLFDAKRPDRPDTGKLGTLRAAASGSPFAVSGWNIHNNGPNPTRFAVPAGAVYFVEGSTLSPEDSLGADDERSAQGWGFALRGGW